MACLCDGHIAKPWKIGWNIIVNQLGVWTRVAQGTMYYIESWEMGLGCLTHWKAP